MNCHHLCWDTKAPRGDEPTAYTSLYTSLFERWPYVTGRGQLIKAEAWRRSRRRKSLAETSLSRFRLRRLAKKAFDVAYVIVANEEEAGIALDCLQWLDIPYVLHWYDLTESEKLTSISHPHIADLAKGAYQVYALTEVLASAISQCSSVNVDILRFGRPVPTKFAKPPTGGGPLRCVLVGQTSYSSMGGIWPKVLEAARDEGLSTELYYIGPREYFAEIPVNLSARYLGCLSDVDRDQCLATMHVALLPGPDGNPMVDVFARYSLPSRLADYLGHGLPVLGTINNSSATAVEIRELASNAVTFSCSESRLARRLVELTGHENVWRRASQAGRIYALKNFDSEKNVDVLASSLKDAIKTYSRQAGGKKVLLDHRAGFDRAQ